MPSHDILVLCHGAHLGATNWLELAIGHPKDNQAGRAPRAIEMALVHGARHILWATGASERDGLRESEYTFRVARENAEDILDYLRRRSLAADFSVEDLLAFLDRTALFDTHTKNTTEEVVNAAKVAIEQGCNRVIQVSSATHIQRCYATAVTWMFQNPDSQLQFMPIHADTCFRDSSPADVVVLEPPHRGDNLPLSLPALVRPLFGLMGMTTAPKKVFGILDDLVRTMKRYGLFYPNPYAVFPFAALTDVGGMVDDKVIREAGPVVPFGLDDYLRAVRFEDGTCAVITPSNGVWRPNWEPAARAVENSVDLPRVGPGLGSGVVWVDGKDAEGEFRVKLYYNDKADRGDALHR